MTVWLEADVETLARTLDRCSTLAASAFAGAHPRRRSDVALYLAHVEASTPLRQLAAASGRPVSSVHRAVRRVEAMRDDPLLDGLFDRLSAAARGEEPRIRSEPGGDGAPSAAERTALAALAAPGAFLMVAQGAERAGVFAGASGIGRPVALVPSTLAARMAARDWLRLVSRTRASARYVLAEAGRRALAPRLEIARAEAGAGEAPALPAAPPAAAEADAPSEAPLVRLASRKGPDGAPFLSEAEIAAGERLCALHARGDRDGLAAALEALGPGLADVAFRACCLQMGLETIERRLGWSARSAKIVLKIALQRLVLGARPGAAAAAMLQCSNRDVR